MLREKIMRTVTELILYKIYAEHDPVVVIEVCGKTEVFAAMHGDFFSILIQVMVGADSVFRCPKDVLHTE